MSNPSQRAAPGATEVDPAMARIAQVWPTLTDEHRTLLARLVEMMAESYENDRRHGRRRQQEGRE